MTLAPEINTGLEIYGLRSEGIAGRAAVWVLLEPHIDRLAAELIRDFARKLPGIADVVTRNESELVGSIVVHTGKLFTQPYDENWVAGLQARVLMEQRSAFDIRSRSAVNRRLLSDFSTILLKRHRFSARKYARLMDVAMRVLIHDAGMAANIHYIGKLKETRASHKEQTSALSIFETATSDVRRAVSAGAHSLREMSQDLRAASDVAGCEAERAASASGAMSEQVRSASSATNDLVVAIEDLEREATLGAARAVEAATCMAKTSATIHSLSEAVKRIGSVVDVIADVAKQTNLLALNATIEAARAGEMGRGFSVVATEVKTLATQTSTATAQVAELIAAVQALTNCAVREIETAGTKIEPLASVSRHIAETVHMQIRSSEGIARSADATASNVTTTAAALTNVSQAIKRTRETAASVLDLSKDLAQQTQALDTAVEALFTAARKGEASADRLPRVAAAVA